MKLFWLKYFWIFLLLIVFAVVAYIIVLAVSAAFVKPGRIYGTNSSYYRFLLYSATALGLFLLRVKVKVNGGEKLPDNCRFMLVSNHRSNFDPLVTWHAFRKKDIAFISKEDNFKVPIFGRLIQRCGFLPIDRSNLHGSLRTVNKAAEMMKNDVVSFGVYPEGTRSGDYKLLPFHDGVFMLAKKAEAPVAVVALRGTEKIHRQYIRRRSDVYLDVLKVIPYSDLESKRTNEIGEKIRKELLDYLGE